MIELFSSDDVDSYVDGIYPYLIIKSCCDVYFLIFVLSYSDTKVGIVK